jgi:Leucine-rich repeat (LRR) protein
VPALEGLVNLTSLNLANNGIGVEGAQALKGRVNLTSLDLEGNLIGPEGAQALEGLVNLTSLDLRINYIGPGVQALKGLVNLTSLDLSVNYIGDEGAQVLKGLVNLTSVFLFGNDIGIEGLEALKGLVNLASLDLQSNDIRDISPLVSLRNLQRINLSGCQIYHDAPAFWMLPSLREAILSNASLTGVPTEILSRHPSDNCLDRLRAHLADLTGNDVAVDNVKSSP